MKIPFPFRWVFFKKQISHSPILIPDSWLKFLFIIFTRIWRFNELHNEVFEDKNQSQQKSICDVKMIKIFSINLLHIILILKENRNQTKGLLKLKMISFHCNKTHAKLIREKWHLELRAESWAIKILLLLQLRQPMANWLSKFSCKKLQSMAKN